MSQSMHFQYSIQWLQKRNKWWYQFLVSAFRNTVTLHLSWPPHLLSHPCSNNCEDVKRSKGIPDKHKDHFSPHPFTALRFQSSKLIEYYALSALWYSLSPNKNSKKLQINRIIIHLYISSFFLFATYQKYHWYILWIVIHYW